MSSVDELLTVVKARQTEELARLTAEAERLGDRRIPGRAAIEERHRREMRRVRTDELRSGLATLADVYRDRLVSPTLSRRRVTPLANACQDIDAAAAALTRNVNESLLLESLFLRLGALSS
jgi:DNA polymerase-3 subunit delta'